MKSTTQRFKLSKLLVEVNKSLAKQLQLIPARAVPGATLLALTAGAFSPVFAQDEQLEEIQITGSRIVRSTMETPTPVTTIQAGDLANMAPGNLIDGLSQMPMFYNNATPESTVGGQNSGGSNVNLRGAGARRTLTLLNGRRIVSSNRFGAVDVNVVPEDLLRSVESVTGGASASYGTDAVAGVVNFLLDTNYEGLKTHSQTGITEYGDGRTWEVGVAGGMQLTDKLHVLGSFSAADQAKIASFSSLQDRDYLKMWSRVTNPDLTGPTELVRPWVYPTNFTRTGVIVEPTNPALNRLVFQQDGSLVPLPTNGIGNINGGCLCLSSNTPGYYGVNGDSELQNEFRRYNSFAYADYDVNENLNVFLQGIYSDNLTNDRNQSIHYTGTLWQTRIYSDNAFLTPTARDLIRNNRPAGQDFVNYGLLTESSPDTVLDEPRMETNNQMYSITAGFNGTIASGGFFDGWNYNGYAQYGKTKQDVDTTMAIRTDRIFLAMDAVRDPTSGQIVCRVNLPQFTGPIASGGNGGLFKDCVPLNTFGGTPNISQAAADYIVDRDGKTARQWTYQEAAEFVMNGELLDGFDAGPITGAFGVSYRKEYLEQRTPDRSDEYPAQVDGTLLSDQGLMPAGIRGLVPQGSTAVPGYNGIAGLRFVPNGFLGDGNSSSVLFTSLRAIEGGFNVKEAFTEINVPLLSDVALADYLEINTAARWADYSGSGDIWAWKVGLNWTLNDQFRVRATQSRDVRAASLQERYDQTRGGVAVRNPWTNLQVSAASLSGGNPNVSPEEADTITAGFVYQPSFLDGFSASIDWYSIDINDAIAQLGNQIIVDNCRNGDLSLCQFVITPTGPVTNPTTATNVIIDRVESLFINLANQRIEGVDTELSYRTDIDVLGGGAEQLGVRFLYSWLGENSTKNPGGIRQDNTGQISGAGLPQNKVTTSLTYMNGTFTAFLQARWIDGGNLLNTYMESDKAIPLSQRPANSMLAACGTNICTIDDNSIPSITYVDMRLGKTFGDEDQLEIYGNVNNLLDRDPNITAGAIGRTGVPAGAAVGGLYDILGRRYTIGVNYEF